MTRHRNALFTVTLAGLFLLLSGCTSRVLLMDPNGPDVTRRLEGTITALEINNKRRSPGVSDALTGASLVGSNSVGGVALGALGLLTDGRDYFAHVTVREDDGAVEEVTLPRSEKKLPYKVGDQILIVWRGDSEWSMYRRPTKASETTGDEEDKAGLATK